MRERDRLALREWREECAREEAAERERQERPVKEAEAALRKTQRELLKVERDRLLGKTDDPFIKAKIGDKPVTDPLAWEGIDPLNREELPAGYATAYNGESLRLYLRDHPEHKDLLANKEFLDMIGNYFDRNKIRITNIWDIKRVVERFIAAGLAPEPPAPAPPPPPQPAPIRFTEPEQPSEPEFQTGWDLDTGTRRSYSRYEIDRMSADEYVRTFRVCRGEMLDAMRQW